MMQKQVQKIGFPSQNIYNENIIIFDKLKYISRLTKNDFFKNIIKYSLKSFEKLGCRIKILGEIYGVCFYNKMIQSELDTAHLKNGANVLMIGCGPLPVTAMYLAKKGFNVTCIDNDDQAITYAEQFEKNQQIRGKIQFKRQDARQMNYSEYDAIWVSFSTHPKKEILDIIYDELKDGGKLVYRDSGSLTKALYPCIDPYYFCNTCTITPQSFGKQSVLLSKNDKGKTMDETTANSIEQKCFNLTHLTPGQKAIICSCPSEQSCLSVLGIRPGKHVKAKAKQPFGGPVLASVDGRMVALDKDLAEDIMVS